MFTDPARVNKQRLYTTTSRLYTIVPLVTHLCELLSHINNEKNKMGFTYLHSLNLNYSMITDSMPSYQVNFYLKRYARKIYNNLSCFVRDDNVIVNKVLGGVACIAI
jgi:hypothetical protein